MNKRESFVGLVGEPRLRLLKNRWLFVMTAFLVLLFPSQPVLADASDKLQTVYHVYIGDTHIGTVDDKDVVKEIIDKKIEENDDDYSALTLTAGENISYIAEKSFQPHYDDEKVKAKLKKDLEIKAETYALEVDGEVVGHFKNKKTVSNLLKAYKSTFVDEAILDELDKQNSPNEPHKIDKPDKKQSLTPGESVVTMVTFSKDVAISKEVVSPETVLTKKKGMKLLQKGTLEDEIYHVEKGDVLESIANDYDLTMKEILKINPDITEDSILQIDQAIHVTAYKPYMDVLIEKEKVAEEKIPFKEEVEKTDDLYKGEEEVTQKGKDGKEEVRYTIQEKNGKRVDKEATEHKIVEKPVKKIVRKGTKVIPSRGTGELSWPVDGGYISSYVGTRWGSLHKGIDIARPNSRTITTADNGVVTEAGNSGNGYGNKIVINHNNGMKTVYAHLSSIDVQVGQTVEKGHSIGVMGSTGNSTGIHLHFEVYKNGELQKPEEYVHP